MMVLKYNDVVTIKNEVITSEPSLVKKIFRHCIKTSIFLTIINTMKPKLSLQERQKA